MNWKACACFAVLLAASVSTVLAQEPKPQEKLLVSYPGKNWGVEIDFPGFVVETQKRKRDGREYLLAKHPTTNIIVSVTLEQVPGGADPKSCSDYLQKRMQSLPSQLSPVDIQTSELGNMAVVEYLIPTAQGISLQQKNFVACLAKDDVYADIHLSKAKFEASDESLFTDVLKKVHTADVAVGATAPLSSKATSSGATSLTYFREGSRHFIAHDYRGAIGPYQAALDIEKRQPSLGRNEWRVLVDNLGMAYGISGDLERSEETYNYGFSKDPGYPGFYYSMACVWAERNNMDEAMNYL